MANCLILKKDRYNKGYSVGYAAGNTAGYNSGWSAGRSAAKVSTLLWTNSDAAAQGTKTVSLDLANYQFVTIQFRAQPNSSSIGQVCATIGMNGYLCKKTDSWNTMGSRYFSVSSTSVYFGGGIGNYADQGNNNCAVPYRIYGWR